MARAVGRRLSSILQLPIGYDMKGPKMMASIPEMEPTPPPKRRESVTVSTIIHDVIPNTCRCRSTFTYQESCTQTVQNDFEKGEEFVSVRKNENPPVTSKINYYFDTKNTSERPSVAGSKVICVRTAENDQPSEPRADYDTPLHKTTVSVGGENSALENCKWSAKESSSVVRKYSHDYDCDSFNHASSNRSGLHVDNDDTEETKYKSVLNISKTDKGPVYRSSVMEEIKSTSTETRSPNVKAKLNYDDIHLFSNASDEYRDTPNEGTSGQYHLITSDEYRDIPNENTSCQFRLPLSGVSRGTPNDRLSGQYSLPSSDHVLDVSSTITSETEDGVCDSQSDTRPSFSRNCSSEVTLVSRSRDGMVSGSSVSSIITVYDDSILDDDVFIPAADYETVYETVEFGAQLNGENINSTHV